MSDIITINTDRTFKTNVSIYLGRDERNRDIRRVFPAEFRLLPIDRVKQLQEDGQDGAFVRAVLVDAKVNMVDAAGVPWPNKIEAIANDPAVSAAVVTAYLRETVSKNDNSKK